MQYLYSLDNIFISVLVVIVGVIASPPRADEAISINLRDCHVVPISSGLLAMTVEATKTEQSHVFQHLTCKGQDYTILDVA
jgi:hypothetical protein